MRYTKKLREEIIRDFASRHDGHWDAALFVEEVRGNPDHPAYEWFEWDRDTAAHQYWVWQAREFAVGVKISFSVETVGRHGTIKVHQTEGPLVISPVEGRQHGGGYIVADPNNPGYMAELSRQGSDDLRRWLARYQAAVIHAGGSVASVQRLMRLLDDAGGRDEAA